MNYSNNNDLQQNAEAQTLPLPPCTDLLDSLGLLPSTKEQWLDAVQAFRVLVKKTMVRDASFLPTTPLYINRIFGTFKLLSFHYRRGMYELGNPSNGLVVMKAATSTGGASEKTWLPLAVADLQHPKSSGPGKVLVYSDSTIARVSVDGRSLHEFFGPARHTIATGPGPLPHWIDGAWILGTLSTVHNFNHHLAWRTRVNVDGKTGTETFSLSVEFQPTTRGARESQGSLLFGLKTEAEFIIVDRDHFRGAMNRRKAGLEVKILDDMYDAATGLVISLLWMMKNAYSQEVITSIQSIEPVTSETLERCPFSLTGSGTARQWRPVS
ncbi:hypothetical protein C8R46DRAFT_1216903 [Mycena filopes]|nr:hypothetical protein C8R46DRAFT_1216903 [Mycena filopes]